MIITISGKPGSGKSTVAKIVAQKLGAVRLYVGGMRRELARSKGMTLEELNEYAKTHPETDVDIDKAAAAKAQELENQGNVVVVEGRTQMLFLPHSLKIYMDVDLLEAAKRIWKEVQEKAAKEERNEGDFTSVEELRDSLEARDAADAARYIKYYHFDHRDTTKYDAVVDTTHLTIEQAAEKVLAIVKKK